MPFTNVWSDTVPTDASLANQLGADIRNLRVDILERMNAVLVNDWTADPLVLQSSISGSGTGLAVTVPFCQMLSNLWAKENDLDAANGFINCFTGQHYAAPVRIPYGCTITQLSLQYALGSCTDVVLSLYHRQLTAAPIPGSAVVDDYDLTGNSVGAISIATSAPLNITLSGINYYWLRLNPQGGAGTNCSFYSATITFNRPSSAYAT